LKDGESPLSFAEKARAACEKYGLAITNYPIGADFIQGSNGHLNAEIERVKEEVRVAHTLGAAGMRHDATQGFPADHPGAKSFDAALPRLKEGSLAVTQFAAELGVRTMVENHGYFCQDSDRVEKLICAVNHPNFGALVDIGNFACVDEDCTTAVGRLAPYAVHIHAKDFHTKSGMLPFPGEGWFKSRGGNYLRGAIIGHGDMPVKQCLQILKNSDYEGSISIEFEGMEDPLTGIRIGLQNLRCFWENIEE
jgi:sugar phosphate isomerase/epimerase